MKKFSFVIFILIIFNPVHAARNPPKWKFQYSLGKSNSTYTEEQSSILFENRSINQISSYQEFHWTYFLLPPYVDISLTAQYTGLNYEKPKEETEQFQALTAITNLGIHIPFSDFTQFKIVLEYFYTSMFVKDDAFGFKNLRGYQAYPELEIIPFGSTMFKQITPFIKSSIWSTVANRRETAIGLKWKIPVFAPQEQIFPTYAYQRSIVLKLFYSETYLNYRRDGFIPADIFLKQYIATIGFSF